MLVRRLVRGVRSSCPGVRHELPLALLRRVEREEHLVERRGQAGQLVVPRDLDRVQLGRPGHALCGGGEPADRTEAVGGDDPAGTAGKHDAGRTGEEEDELEPFERPLDRLHRLGQHERRSLTGLHRDDAVRLAVERGGAARALGLADRHLDLVIVERQCGVVATAAEDLSAAHDEDLDAGEVELLRRRGVAGADRGIGPLEHRLVERALELRAHRDEHERAHGREGDRDRGGGQEGDAHRERRACRQGLDEPMNRADRGPATAPCPDGFCGFGHGGVSRRT